MRRRVFLRREYATILGPWIFAIRAHPGRNLIRGFMFARLFAKKVVVSFVVAVALGSGVAASASTSARPHIRAHHSAAKQPHSKSVRKPGTSLHRSRYVPNVVTAMHPFRIAAKIIGIRWQTLYQDVMHHGATIASVATAHGVNPQVIIDAIEQAGAKFDAREAGRMGPVRLQFANGRLAKLAAHLVNSSGSKIFYHSKAQSNIKKAQRHRTAA